MQQCPQLLFQLEAVFYCDKTLSTASDKIGTLELELNYHMKKRDCIVSRRDTMGCMDSNSGSEMILQNSVFPHFLVLPFMMLTSFYLVVLSDSRFSIEGDKSKSNIFVFRFKAPAAAPRVSLEAVLNLTDWVSASS